MVTLVKQQAMLVVSSDFKYHLCCRRQGLTATVPAWRLYVATSQITSHKEMMESLPTIKIYFSLTEPARPSKYVI